MYIQLSELGGRIRGDARRGVGASCHVLIIKVYGRTYCYLIDCGMDFSAMGNPVSWEDPIGLAGLKEFPEINDAFVSHVHRDHGSCLARRPVLSRMKKNTRLFCSRPTAAFLPHVLADQRSFSDRREEEVPYSVDDINALLERMKIIFKPGVLELVPGIVSVCILPSGHTRGSCQLIFLVQENRKKVKIMFSGDYAVHDTFSTVGALLPPNNWSPDIIGSFDCTFGGLLLKSWDEEMDRLIMDSREMIARGGDVLVFASAFDYCPIVAQKLGELGIPVCLDGYSMVNFAHTMCSEDGVWCEQDQTIMLDAAHVCERPGEALGYFDGPCAIVASSGTGQGPAARYLASMAYRDDVLIVAPGLVVPGSNGHRIMQAKHSDGYALIEVDGEMIRTPVYARCEQYGLITHSRQQDAIPRIGLLLENSQFLKSTGHPLVGLHHGSFSALNAYENALSGLQTFRGDIKKDRDIVLVDW
ncbi:MAG: hypothetical protein HY007_00065 [Candidatus Sungbacteria bacterium]|nr:hypothetical protein [Candidatus Sungbacteria bacterium]